MSAMVKELSDCQDVILRSELWETARVLLHNKNPDVTLEATGFLTFKHEDDEFTYKGMTSRRETLFWRGMVDDTWLIINEDEEGRGTIIQFATSLMPIMEVRFKEDLIPALELCIKQ